ncbi:MAG: dTDP-4-dehydrorhamnose reductase [Armatimonadetes bacterium]|nr:dTDP-4-dehydrorhamnose reductase [Armatimonadota bacterium]MDW8027896.1 dTDP-4-dehydrorhamnose reductase [Armatimonadota bacterium]
MPYFVVLGASGQLGSEILNLLPKEETLALTREQLDITDFIKVQAVLKEARPKVVFNCTGFVRVDDAEERTKEAWEVNALAVLFLAKVSAELNATIVNISTDYVFDGRKGAPYTELDVPNPLSVYGVTKLAGEFFAKAYCPKHFIVRTAGLYGKRGSRAKGGSFVDRILQKAKSGEPLKVVSDQVTSPTYARDLASHLVKLVETEKFGLYHIANRGYCSWHEFATTIIQIANLNVPVEPIRSDQIPLKAKRPSFSALVSVRLLSAGLPPLRHWHDALTEFLKSHEPDSLAI